MSRNRIVIRVVLGVLLLGMLGLLGRTWLVGSTGDLAQAERAISTGNLEKARIHLLKLLQEDPENLAGHLALAQTLLSEAQTRHPQASYANTPKALFHREAAAKLDESNLVLQKELLTIFMTQRQPGKGAAVAKRIIALEPDNAIANFALVWQLISTNGASAKNSEQVQKQLDHLLALKDRPKFQASSLAIQHYDAVKAVEAKNKVVSAAVQDAVALSGEQLSALPPEENRALNHLLQYAIGSATSVEELIERLDGAIKTCETLADSGGLAADLLIRSATNKSWNDASEQQLALRSSLEQRGRTLLERSVSAGTTLATTYRWLAIDTRSQDVAKAIEILEKGIVACAGQEGSSICHDLHLLAAEYLFETRDFSRARELLAEAKDLPEVDGQRDVLEGRIASAEGRYTAALNHFLVARTHLGDSSLLDAMLTDTLLKLRRWNAALPYLARLRDALAADSGGTQKLFGFTAQSVRWKMAQCYMALNNWDEAQPILADLASTQLAPQVISALAIRDVQLGKAATAFARLSEAHEQRPNDLTLLKTYAQLLFQFGETEKADTLMEAAAANPEASKEILGLATRWNLGRKNEQRALALVAQLEKDYGDDPMTTALKAETYLRSGMSEELNTLVERLKQDPQTRDFANLLSAASEFQGNDLNGALAQLNEIENPNVFSDLLRGEIALRQEDHTVAISSLSSLLEVTSHQQRAGRAILLSVLQIAQKESPQRAEELVDEMLQSHPDDFFLIVAKAEMGFSQGRFDDGIASLDNLERHFPALPTAAQIKAVAWLRRNRLDRAKAEIERALALKPDDLISNRLAAEIYLAAKEYRQVLKHTTAALAVAPNKWGLYLVHAEALRRTGNREAAIKTIRWLVNKQPSFFTAHRVLIAILHADGQLEAALTASRTAQKAHANVPLLAAGEVALLCYMKRYDDAENRAASYKAQHTNAPALLLLARAFAGSQQLNQAREIGQTLLTDKSDDIRVQTNAMLGDLALVEHQQRSDAKLLESARDHFAAAVAIQPNHLSAANNLAWLLATEFSDVQKAITVLEKAQGNLPVAALAVEFIDTLAVAYDLNGQRGRALKVLDTALASRGESPGLLYRYAIHLSAGPDVTAAKTMLTRCLSLPLPVSQLLEVQRTLAELSQADKMNSDTSVTLSSDSPK